VAVVPLVDEGPEGPGPLHCGHRGRARFRGEPARCPGHRAGAVLAGAPGDHGELEVEA
jgi:hypothetical protein